MRRSMYLRACALLVLFALAASAQATRTPHPVVLISIDGLKPEYVVGPDEYGLKIPNLRGLVARGAHASGVTGVVPTVTYPSHTTLVTGVTPARHGITSNTTFDPLRKNQDGWYWYASDIRVPTLWDAVAAAGGTSANVHWPVTVGARITWNMPQYWRSGEADDRKLVRALSTSGLYDALEKEVGVPYADGTDESIAGDELRAQFAERLMEDKRPTLMLAYFTALDHEQHTSGPFSPTSLTTLERIDQIIGGMLASVKRAYGDSVVVAIVSDHGFRRVTKSLNIVHALRTAGLIEYSENGDDKPLSWRAAAWVDGGAAAIVLRDSTDADARARVEKLLASLVADSANGIDRVFKAEEVHQHGGYPGASYLISMRDGYTIAVDPRGPLVGPSNVGGTHGYWHDVAAMRASFIIAGPGIPAGRDLGVIDQRAIAPTLARILAVPLPDAEVAGILP